VGGWVLLDDRKTLINTGILLAAVVGWRCRNLHQDPAPASAWLALTFPPGAYAKVRPELQRTAADAMERVLG
jgi:hypothetical protein